MEMWKNANTMSTISRDALQSYLTTSIEFYKKGGFQEALAILRPLLQQFPGHPRILYLLGLCLETVGDLVQAIHLISRAVASEPDNAEFHKTLGVFLRKNGRMVAALERLRESVRLQPENTEYRFILGDVCMDLGQSSQALEQFSAAVDLRPDFLEAWGNLGLCYKADKQLDQARACFEKIILLDPDNARGHVNLALTLLLLGAYPEGWRQYEWRFRMEDVSALFCQPPVGVCQWQGASLQGKTILLISEQGFGDNIQFFRYLARLKSGGARTLLCCPTPLLPLFENQLGLDRVGATTDFNEKVDFFLPLLSLPRVLGTTLETIPANHPYLHPDPQKVAIWHQRLPPAPLRVGLVWSGKPLHQNDPLRRRSCSLENLAPLAGAAEKILFVSLQKATPAFAVQQPPAGMWLLDVGDALTDFSQTAALMANLDLIITIDTAAAHLAGAMGKLAWILLPFSPDWRWLLDRQTTPWYPNLRLFRQTQPNRWQDPVAEMVEELKKI